MATTPTLKQPPTTSVPTAASIAPNPMASPSLAGDFAVDPSGRKVALRCYGTGSPTVFLESGGGAIDEFTRESLTRRLATQTQVCLYNRAGLPPSDPAPNEPREAEDVAGDFHALVTTAGIAPPYVLFGRSFGGMIVTFYASEHPSDVAGVVVFDSPAPSATMTLEEFPEGVWDFPGNLEHLNVLTGFENRFGKAPVHFDAPLVLISTTAGESRPDDRYWLQVSPQSRQVVLEGGMEAIGTEADQIVEEIMSFGAPSASPS
ncbi:MAG: alpha/beta fold hydrolase [Candidatus Limnocylindrales bacterium]